MKPTRADREFERFVETSAGDTAVRTLIANGTGEEVPVVGALTQAGATGPFKTTVGLADDTISNPLPVPLTNRQSLCIRNKSLTETIYFCESLLKTPDDTATGGWEIGPGEDFSIDLDASNAFFLVCQSGKTAVYKIQEIASTGSGGGMSGTPIQEAPAGAVNGANVSFALSQTPLDSAYVQLYLNGVFQTQGTHYTIFGTAITMIAAPLTGQILDAVYVY